MASETRSLIRAAADGDADAVRALLAQGIDVNACSERGQTALMLAAVSGRDDIVSLLLAAGADVTLIDSLGLTATEWSLRRGFSDIAQLIAKASPAKLPLQTNERAAVIDLESHSGDRTSTSIKAVRGQSAAETEIASKPDGARTENNAKPKAGLLDVLRARAAQMAQADTEAETLRHQAIIAQSDHAETIQDAQTEQLNSATPEAEPPAIEDDTTKPRIEPDRAFAESPKVLEEEINIPSARQTQGFVPANQRDTTRLSSVEVPSFDQLPANSAGRPLLWVMIAFTLFGAAFVTYRLTNNSVETASPAPAVATKTDQPTVVAAAKPLPVVGGALAGAEVTVPEPEYPTDSEKKNNTEAISSTVTVLIKVNRKGKVLSTRVLNGEGPLGIAAIKAARKATFAPEKFPAKGRMITGTITYTFAAPPTEPPATSGSPAASPAVSESPITSEKSVANPEADLPVTGDALAGAEIKLPKAEYPESARSRGISGTITVTVRVNRAGKVISWLTSTGDPLLRAAALKAAKRATFAPKKLPGKGDVVGTITYTFKS